MNVRRPWRISCSPAPLAKAAPAAAIALATLNSAVPPKVDGQQVGPGELHRPPPVADDDHVAALGAVEDDGAPTAAAVVVDEVAHRAAGLLEAEPDDRAGAAPAHPAHEGVVGVEHGEPVARHRLDDDGLDVGELLEGVDAAHAEVVGRDVRDDGDVVAVVAQALAQDAAAGHLHDGEVDARVLEHHPGRARPGGVGLARRAARR